MLSSDDPAPGNITAAMKRRLVRGGSALSVTRLLAQVVQWVTTFVVARLLSPNDYGLMATASLLLNLGDIVISAGLGKALVYKDKVEPHDVRQVFTINLALSVVVAAIMLIAARPMAQHLGHPGFAPVLIFLVIWFLALPLVTPSNALLARELRLREQAIVVIVMTPVQSVSMLLLAMSGFGVWSLAIAPVLGRITQSILLLYFSGWRPGFSYPTQAVWPMVTYGATLTLSALVWFAQYSSDQAIVATLLDVSALGAYSLALLLVGLFVTKGVDIVNDVVFPLYCRLAPDRERMVRAFALVVRLMTLVVAPSLVGMTLVGADAVPLLFGRQWLPAVQPLQILGVAGTLMVITKLTPPLFNALGRPDINLKVSLVQVAILPPCFFVFGWLWGLAGICLVNLVVTPILLAGTLHLTRPVTGLTPGALAWQLGPIAVGVTTMAVAVALCGAAFPDPEPSVLRLIARIIVGAVTYAAVVLLLWRRQILADFRLILESARPA